MSFFCCPQQRRLTTLTILAVDVDALHDEQQLDYCLLSILCRIRQRRPTTIALAVDVDALRGEQQLDYRLMSFLRCPRQHRLTIIILGFEVDTQLDQYVSSRLATVLR